MLKSSLIIMERDDEYERVMSKTEKGEVENGIQWTGSPCCSIRELVNGTVSVRARSGHRSGAAERTAMSDPKIEKSERLEFI